MTYTTQNPWSISPNTINWICQFIQRKQLRNIIECGSGASTVMLVELMQQSSDLSVISLDHEDRWFKDTYRQLAERNLPTVCLEYAALKSISLQPPAPGLIAQTYQWYDYRPSQKQKCDLLLIDGPPGGSSAFARLPAPYLISVEPGGYILLDDYEREEEQAIVQRWQHDLGLDIVETVRFEHEDVYFNTTLVVLHKPRWAWLKAKWRHIRLQIQHRLIQPISYRNKH